MIQRYPTRRPVRAFFESELGFALTLIVAVIVLPAIGGLILEACGYGLDLRVGAF